MQLQEGPDWAIIYRVNTTDKLNRQKRFGATTWEFIQVFLAWSVSSKQQLQNLLRSIKHSHKAIWIKIMDLKEITIKQP